MSFFKLSPPSGGHVFCVDGGTMSPCGWSVAVLSVNVALRLWPRCPKCGNPTGAVEPLRADTAATAAKDSP